MADPASVSAPVAPLGMQRRFHAMVKPVGSQCNLDCTYCYYLHKEGLLHQPKQPRMSEVVLEAHIRQYIEAQTGDEVVFSWQGGEPMLLGIDFFRKVVELEAKYQKPGQRIENDLQTNGTLLNDEWAAFLKQHHFLVGLSCDGPKELHDHYRVSKGGKPTHNKVVAAARLLKKYDVPFNALCVVNRLNAKRPREVHRFLIDELGVWRVQYIPCVEPKNFRDVAPQHWDPANMPIVGTSACKPGASDSIVTDWSVDADEWGTFLSAVWNEWYRKDYGRVHVDLFETAVAQSLGMPSQRCVTAEFCGKGMALEHDGSAYACDHYVYPEFKMGDIRDNHWGEIAFSPAQQRFGFAKRDTLPTYCKECPHLKLCWGECPKNRFLKTPSGEKGLNYLCPGLKRFFTHIQKDMPTILKQIQGVR